MSLISKSETTSHFWGCKTTWKNPPITLYGAYWDVQLGFWCNFILSIFSPNTNQFIIFITAIFVELRLVLF